MNEEEKKALKVINTRTRRLLNELEIEKEDMSDEPKIAYLMQEIRANKIILNLVEKLQKENEELKGTLRDTQNSWFEDTKKMEKLKNQNQCYINSIQSIAPVLIQEYIEK